MKKLLFLLLIVALITPARTQIPDISVLDSAWIDSNYVKYERVSELLQLDDVVYFTGSDSSSFGAMGPGRIMFRAADSCWYFNSGSSVLKIMWESDVGDTIAAHGSAMVDSGKVAARIVWTDSAIYVMRKNAFADSIAAIDSTNITNDKLGFEDINNLSEVLGSKLGKSAWHDSLALAHVDTLYLGPDSALMVLIAGDTVKFSTPNGDNLYLELDETKTELLARHLVLSAAAGLNQDATVFADRINIRGYSRQSGGIYQDSIM